MSAPKTSKIGGMNRRPYFFNETYTTDAGGGGSNVETERWQSWAEIKDRTGSGQFTQSQDVMIYDYRVRVRFDGRFNSNTMMIYEGQICKCQSMSIETEGYKDFLVLRYNKTDTWVDLS